MTSEMEHEVFVISLLEGGEWKPQAWSGTKRITKQEAINEFYIEFPHLKGKQIKVRRQPYSSIRELAQAWRSKLKWLL